MMKSKIFLILWASCLLAFSSLTALAQSTGSSKPIELRLAHMMPVGSPSDKHIRLWAKKVAKESNGKLKVRIFPANTLIPGPEIYDAVKKGTVDLGLSWRYKPEGYTMGVALPLILGAPDTVTGSLIYDEIWKKFPKEMGKEWEDVKVLYLVASVPNHIASRKELRRCEDIKGQQIRVPAPQAAFLVKELGGVPVFMSSGDFIVGLDKGTVDGAVLLSCMVADYKLGGKIKQILMNPLGVAGPVFLAMNKDSYDKLPPDLKEVLDKTTAWAKEEAIKSWAGTLESSKKYFEKSGIEMIYLTGEEQQKLMRAYNAMCDETAKQLNAKGYPGTEVVEFIRERVKHYAK